MTPETRAKIAASMRGNKNALGCKKSASSRRKIAIAMKGNSNGCGRTCSPTTKAKMMAGLKRPRAELKRRESLRIAHRVIKLFKPEIYEAMRERARAAMQAHMKDPAFRAKAAAAAAAYRKRRRSDGAGMTA